MNLIGLDKHSLGFEKAHILNGKYKAWREIMVKIFLYYDETEEF